jgi:hypothetical protein
MHFDGSEDEKLEINSCAHDHQTMANEVASSSSDCGSLGPPGAGESFERSKFREVRLRWCTEAINQIIGDMSLE